ncbi:hypothetical protein BPOR_0002g00300 [Botrytis porri]|uniref:NAD-dependent epimerase/dehydratase domain-containing protein n=1 Tax=Botrytis porri TaxID=87229 RepID=A0A4Z1L787_9HELO|nr:hypothetical protein BPOR_0002g00300 [Botrytis porri]
MVATILITGCSRGLGLALASEFSKAGYLVFATARGNPTPALEELIKSSPSTVKYIKLDATNRSSVQKRRSRDDLESVLNSNVTSAHIVTSTFLPLLKQGAQKKVINMSSSGGSIERSPVYSNMALPAYKVSKAALNMLTVPYAQSYADEGFTYLPVNPSWLRTDLGGASADLDVETGAKAVIELIESNGKESNGEFLNIRVAGWKRMTVSISTMVVPCLGKMIVGMGYIISGEVAHVGNVIYAQPRIPYWCVVASLVKHTCAYIIRCI